MLWTSIKRVLRSGFMNFWRNSVVSVACVFVMTVTLFTIGSVIFVQATLDATLAELRDKVDINVYFATNAAPEEILRVKGLLEALPEVAHVEYVSREQALANFKQRHENDQLTLQALQELNSNPLGAVLNIRAKETSQYEGIAVFLDKASLREGNSAPLIESVNYFQNKTAIDRLSKIIAASERLSVGITFLLIILSVLITFSTIRLTIYTSRDEIAVMRLVGASTFYTRAPFLVEGMISGVFAGVIAIALFYPLTLWLGPITQNFFTALNVFEYYQAHFGELFVIIMGSGVLLGGLSSYLAVKRYLKV